MQSISAWTLILQQVFPIFTQPGANIFSSLLTGWILCTARRTVTAMIPLADPLSRRAHDAYHRFFPDAKFSLPELWKILARLLIATFAAKGVIPLALDDTLFHRSGRKVNGAGYWRDAVRSTQTKIVYAWGLNLAVLTLQVQPPWGGEPLGLPINMRLHRKNEKSLIELAREMIEEVAAWCPSRTFRVVADGFYASLAGLHLRNTTIISRLRRDASLCELPPKKKRKGRGRPRKRGKELPKLKTMASRVRKWRKVKFIARGHETTRLVYSRIVLWYKVSKTPVLLVISRDPAGKEKDDYFFTTDVRMKVGDVLAAYADRWAIEDTFKHTKQHLGPHQPQTWARQGPERAAALGLWLYSAVWLWFCKQPTAKRRFRILPWYASKTTPSFADALGSLRRTLWNERFIMMFGDHTVHDKKYRFLLEALAPAA